MIIYYIERNVKCVLRLSRAGLLWSIASNKRSHMVVVGIFFSQLALTRMSVHPCTENRTYRLSSPFLSNYECLELVLLTPQ